MRVALSMLLFFLFFLGACNQSSDRATELIKRLKSTENPAITWEEYANQFSQKNPTAIYSWNVDYKDSVYIVRYTERNGDGLYWVVDLNRNSGFLINSNLYYGRKYGFQNVIDSTVFIMVTEPKTSFYLSKEGNIVSDFRKMKVNVSTDKPNAYFECLGSLVNKSGKAISFAKLEGKVNVIYKDKVVELNNVNTGSFDSENSTDSLWKPNEARSFYIKTNGLENIYLNYKPEYMEFVLSIDAEDPIGFKYQKTIYLKNILELWDKVKESKK